MTRFNYAAYAPEDVKDAKRRRPGLDLSDYASARGLEFRGGDRLAGFAAVTPLWSEYIFNCCRGWLPGGEWGLIEHELDEVRVDQDHGPQQPGPYYGQRATLGGAFFNLARYSGRDEPFGLPGMFLPATNAAISLTEAAVLPPVTIGRAERFQRSATQLGELGLPGFAAAGPAEREPQLLSELVAGPAGRVLASLDWPYVALRIDSGQVGLRRNGYVSDPAALDAHVEAACTLAAAVRDVARARHRPQPVTAELPPPRWADPAVEAGDHDPLYSTHYWELFRRVSAERGMALEDPLEYHRAFPTVPVAGTATGVLRGEIPGTAQTGRLAWHHEGFMAALHLRGALVLGARPGAETPPNGITVEVGGVAMVGQVRDGLAAAWTLQRNPKDLDFDGLVRRGPETLRRLGLADV